VAQETGAPVYELDPLVTGDGEMTAYEDTMRKNLTVLQEALGE
jgi:zinc transport system substrate-binding protein